ncbi:lactosylceramide 4-alpha-galactosyltransferase [Ixodes scapularis]
MSEIREEHRVTHGGLPDWTKSGENFFFVETSGISCLTSRQACSIESAARTNRGSTVFLLTVRELEQCSYMDHLRTLPNFKYLKIDVGSVVNGTPLDFWYTSSFWTASPFQTEHFSDALRLLILWKYGGAYADLDVMVLKDMAGLTSSLCRELFPMVGNGVMRFQKEHPFLASCLVEFARAYTPQLFAHNGPRLLERTLDRLCPKKPVMHTPYFNVCSGVTVLPHEAFYPVPYTEWRTLFQASSASHVLRLVSKSYTLHLWNSQSKSTYMEPGSAYDALMKTFCPVVYALSTAHNPDAL